MLMLMMEWCRLSCFYMVLESHWICDLMIMCVLIGRPMSLYLIYEECDYEHVHLVDLTTFVMNVYEWILHECLGSVDLRWYNSMYD